MTHSEEHELTCPVCRARQPQQSACRRCAADLQLYVKALRSLHIAQRRLDDAQLSQDESQRQAIVRYLTWLHPPSSVGSC